MVRIKYIILSVVILLVNLIILSSFGGSDASFRGLEENSDPKEMEIFEILGQIILFVEQSFTFLSISI